MKLTFPHMGNLWMVAQTLFESLGIDVIVPPENSKRTLDLGTRLSPESTCLPLKLNLGNFIEAAEKGADTIAISGGEGPCRFGLYGELEQQRGAMHFAYRKILVMDRLEDMIHRARVFFANPGDAEILYSEAKRRLANITSYSGLQGLMRWLDETIQERNLGKDNARGQLNQRPLRIGIVGEIYTLLDSFSSADVERQLGQLGVLVDRSIYLSGWVAEHILFGYAKGYRSLKDCQLCAKPYLNHFVGGHGQQSVGGAVKFAKEGFDGVIHLFPLTCMPEIVASSILPRVQNDYNIPIMTLIMDEHTGYAGVQTRLEAFVDLLERSRRSFTRVETAK